jgi:hypothetical protein
MPLSADFSSSESLSVLSNVRFLDISTGSDSGLTERRIYCRLANGNWLLAGGVQSTTEAYTTWPIADSSITIALLVQSTVASVRVDWLTGATVTYTKTHLTIWNLYDYVFYFGLIQSQTATPTIVSDTNYYNNCFIFITNIFNSESAVTYGNDLYSSNSALLKNQWLINNANNYF